MTWFAVENDEIGGWSIGNRNVPTSRYVRKLDSDDRIIAELMTKADADYVAKALNQYERWLEAQRARDGR